MMKALTIAIAVGLALAACATAPSGPLKEGEVRVQALKTPGTIQPGGWQATFEGVEKPDSEIKLTQACLTWVTLQFRDGPYCSIVASEDPAAKLVTSRHVTMNPNNYTIYGYLMYTYKGQTRQSNTVSGSLLVR